MEIKTKFNIDDVIWHTERIYNEEIEDFETKVCPCPKKIVRIDICCWNILYVEHKQIIYLTEHLDGATSILYLNENCCFATKEQAEEYIRRTE